MVHGSKNGCNISQHDANKTKAQKWYIEVNDNDTTVRFRSACGTDKYMDVNEGKANAGQNVQLYEKNSSNAQKFKLNKLSDFKFNESERTIEDGIYKIKAHSDNNYVVDASLDNKENLDNIYIYNDVNGDNQKWVIKYINNGYYNIYPYNKQSVAMDVSGGSADTKNNTNVQQYKKNNTNAQRWRIVDIGNGEYTFVSACGTANNNNTDLTKIGNDLDKGNIGNLRLDLTNNEIFDKSNIEVYEANASDAQKFKLDIIDGLETNNSDEDTNTDSNFKIIKNGTYEIKTELSGDYYQLGVAQNGNIELTEDTNGKPEEQKNQEFKITYTKSGYSTIKNIGSSKLVEVEGSGTKSGTNVQQFENYDGNNQKWMFKEAGVDNEGKICYYIVSKCNGLYLGVADGVAQNGKNIAVYTYTKDIDNALKFKLARVGENDSKASETDYDREWFNYDFSCVRATEDPTDTTTIMANAHATRTEQEYYMSYDRDLKKGEATFKNTLEDGNYNINSSTENTGYKMADYFTWGVEKIDNINLGLYKREQPQIQLEKQIQNVRLEINGYSHIYTYKDNTGEGQTNDIGVKWEKSGKTYTRTIYKSDIEYENPKDKEGQLKVYITYKIVVTNNSNNIYQDFGIVDYFDKGFKKDNIKVGTELEDELVKEEEKGFKANVEDKYENDNYFKMTITDTVNDIKLGPGPGKAFFVEYEVEENTVGKLMNSKEDVILRNVAEINQYSSYTKAENGYGYNYYAAVDKTSAPGNANPIDVSTFEMDTDLATGLKLELNKNNRTLTGTVFEDNKDVSTEIKTGEVREGNGYYDTSEPTIAGVEVTMQECMQSGDVNKDGVIDKKDAEMLQNANANIIQLNEEEKKRADVNGDGEVNATDASMILSYAAGEKVELEWLLATGIDGYKTYTTTTNEYGSFNFSEYIPGKYKIIYTWGGQTYVKDGITTTYDVKKYKGTIFNEKEHESEKWHIPYEEGETRYSDAKDDYETRQEIDNTIYDTEQGVDISDTFKTKIDSITPTMLMGIEDGDNQIKNITTDENGTIKFEYNIKNIDFGIIERARQQITIDKRVSHIKLAYADGRILINTDIDKGKRTPEFTPKGLICPGPSPAYPDGFISIEFDNETIQGSTLEVTYAIEVQNQSELDYANKDFYWHGKKSTDDSNLVTMTADVYDYLDSEWGFESDTYEKVWNEETEIFKGDEETIPIAEIRNEETEILQEETILKEDIIKANGTVLGKKGDTLPKGTIIKRTKTSSGEIIKEISSYSTWKNETIQKWHTNVLNEDVRIMLTSKDNNIFKQIKPSTKVEDNTRKIELKASKVLTSTDDLSLSNSAEIVKIERDDGKGAPVSISGEFKNKAEDVDVIPPTGGNQNKLPYIITGAVALITIAGGIILIKKKAI